MMIGIKKCKLVHHPVFTSEPDNTYFYCLIVEFYSGPVFAMRFFTVLDLEILTLDETRQFIAHVIADHVKAKVGISKTQELMNGGFDIALVSCDDQPHAHECFKFIRQQMGQFEIS